MKNFKLLFALTAVLSTALVSASEQPVVPGEDLAVVETPVVTFRQKVYAATVQPVVDGTTKCINTVDAYATTADEKITSVCAPVTNYVQTLTTKVVDACKPATDCAQNSFENVASFVQRPTVIIAALAVAAGLVIYKKCNKNSKK